MSRPWPTTERRPAHTVPLSMRIVVGVAVFSTLVLIVGVVMVSVRPPDPEAARVTPGDARFARGDPEGALELWRREVEAEPTAELWSRIGIGELAMQRIDEARAAFEKALELDPDRVDALSNLARIEAPDDFDRALQLLDRAQELDPKRAGIRLVRGELYLERGEYARAREAFIDELNLNPSSGRAWIELRRCDRLEKEGKENGGETR